MLHLCCNHWTKSVRPFCVVTQAWRWTIPLYKLQSPPPSARYLQPFLFCNKTLWVRSESLPHEAPPRVTPEDRNNVLCVCMRCFQTVAYLISCCVWLTSYLRWELFGLLNAPQLSSKSPKCELCDFSINNSLKCLLSKGDKIATT